MNISEKKLENSTVELLIDVPLEKVELEYKAVFDRIKNSVKIDGFRKGKAPLQLIENRFREKGDQEVAENLLKSVFWEAVNEKQLTPIALPKYEFDKISREETFSFKAIFEVPPTVEIGKYKSIPAEENQCNVIDENINTEIEAIRERSAKTTKKEENAMIEKGDFVRLNVKRIDDIDEIERDNLEFKEFSLIAGKNRDEYALDKYIVGMKAGEEKEVDVKYPKDYYMSDLAGQKVKYQLKIAEIIDVELPELNDEFAKNMGYDSVDDFRSKTREYLEKFVSERTRGDAKAIIIRTIIDNSKFDIPESMIAREMDNIFKKTQERFGLYLNNIDEFASSIDMDADAFKDKLREDAAQSIKTTLILSEIAKKEELKVNEEQYKEVIESIAKKNNKTAEEIESMISKNNSRENVESELLLDSSMDFVYENAKIKKLKPIHFEDLIKQGGRG